MINLKTGWKTTVAGLIVGIIAAVEYWHPAWTPQCNTLLGIAAALGLIVARDNHA